MSKTLGNVIDPEELIVEYGAEALRYYLMRHISPFEDGEINRESFKESYNADLANGLGNLVARVMKLAETYLDQPVIKDKNLRVLDSTLQTAIEHYDVSLYMSLVWMHLSNVDEAIQKTEPFKVIKEDKAKGIELIQNFVKEFYLIAKMIEPVMPETSKKIIEAVIANKKPENLFARKD